MADALLEIADELYALPPGEFIAARDALVKEHKGDKSLSATIKAMRKPSVAAWAVNLLVRRESEQIDQMVAVGEALREAQEGMDAAQLRELTKQRRALTHAVAGRARGLVTQEGQRLTPATLEQIEATLTAAMIDRDAAKAVRSGLLVQTLTATGVDAVDVAPALAVPEALGFAAPARATGTRKRPGLHVVPDPDADRKAREAAEAALAEAEATLALRRDELGEAESSVEALEARSLQVQAEIDEVKRRLAELEEALESDEQELAEAEDARDEALEELEAATRVRDEAAEALARTHPPQG